MLRRNLCLTLIALLAAAPAVRAEEKTTVPDLNYPHLQISNGIVDMTVMLPDAVHGYYRGARFDWSGLVYSAEYQGHTFFGPWQSTHDPAGNDGVVGPAEEFGMGIMGLPAPLGYAQAKPGETFLKIGVGLEEKIEEKEYRFGYNYKIVQPGTWTVTHGPSWVEFHQAMSGPGGYAYDYTKRLELVAGRPQLLLSHRLRNTGTQLIEQPHYAHNFIILDDAPVGPTYVTKFLFPLQSNNNLGDKAWLDGNELLFSRRLQEKEALFTELGGFQGTVAENGVTVRNRRTGAEVTVRGDQPIVAFNFFATARAVCPEPFIMVKVAPGRELTWDTTYSFAVGPVER